MNMTNSEKSDRAFGAINEAYEETNTTEENIVDIIIDIRHLCDTMNYDFAGLAGQGFSCYVDERDGE